MEAPLFPLVFCIAVACHTLTRREVESGCSRSYASYAKSIVRDAWRNAVASTALWAIRDSGTTDITSAQREVMRVNVFIKVN